MRIILTFLLWGALCCFTTENPPHGGIKTNVYICTGKSAYSYHNNRNCRGLNRCSAEIKSVSLDYAKSIGRLPCKICY